MPGFDTEKRGANGPPQRQIGQIAERKVQPGPIGRAISQRLACPWKDKRVVFEERVVPE